MTVKRPRPLRIFSDASVYHNGQKGLQDAYYAVVVDDGKTDKGTLVLHEGIGSISVNESEYRGVIAALTWIARKDIDRPIVLITDSQFVYKHIKNQENVPTFDHLRKQAVALLEATEVKLMWKPRKRNKAGWFFENLIEQKRKQKYRIKKERKRAKRKKVRAWTLQHPELSGYRATSSAGLPEEAQQVPVLA